MAKQNEGSKGDPLMIGVRPATQDTNLSRKKPKTRKALKDEAFSPNDDTPRPKDKPPGKDGLPPIELYYEPVRKKQREVRYTPFLLIRSAAGDIGSRPLPSGTVFWHSPDVWVRSSHGINQPVADEPNQMFCRVSNRGSMDAGWVHIRYWWANPSLAITEASANLVGTADTYLPAGQSRVVECPTPWVPVIENDGHECILAEAWCPSLDPLLAPLDPVIDRHAGQKNLHVMQVAGGEQLKFTVEVANIAPTTQPVLIHARWIGGKEALAAVTAGNIGLTNRELTAAANAVPVRLHLADEGIIQLMPQTTYARRLLALQTAGIGWNCRSTGGTEVEATLRGGEIRRLTIAAEVPQDFRTGSIFGYELTQRQGDFVTGGYTLYVLVVD